MLQNEALFYNFSDEDFTWKANGVDYTFKAGSVTPMTKGEFDHFSKHLIDRELIKEKKRTNDELARAEYLKKCTGTTILASEVSAPLEQEKPKSFCEYCVSKGGRHMKDCKRPADKQEDKPFADADEASSTK